jgi:glycosyltransferase involved in cell wall biosynthesis
MIEISVIIPLYNAENTITATLDSVRNQIGNFCFEIFIINDASTDKSNEIVEKYKIDNQNLNIKILQLESNKGVSVARNIGLKNATKDYIAFLDADDCWLPEKTKQQMAFFIEKYPKIDGIACCRNNETVGFPYRVNPKTNLASISLKKMLIRNICPTPTVILKKEIIDNIGLFNEDMRHAEDANYWLRISEKYNLFILDKSLVTTGGGKKSFGVSGLSADLTEMEKGFQKNLKEMYHSNRINWVEYFLFFIFAKIKYFSRPLRLLFLKNNTNG